jgi:hypothetical protein
MPLGIAISRVTPLYPVANFIQWDLLTPTESGSYLFDIHRSGSSSGPWEALQLGAVDKFNYLDSMPQVATAGERAINQLSMARQIYYRIVAIPPSGRDHAVESISPVEPFLNGIQKMLKRKFLYEEMITLKKLNGVPVVVLKRMRWGPRCTRCFDKVSNQIVRSGCMNCAGTGFVPGYFAPVLTYARRGTRPLNSQVTPQGKTDTVLTQVTLLDIPKVGDDDVLVFPRDNLRFRVAQLISTELQTVAVHQKLVVSELARGSIEYCVPVDAEHIPPLF